MGMCVFCTLCQSVVHCTCVPPSAPCAPKHSRLPADPTILIDTTSLYGAKHPGVTVVPSSGGRKASCDAEKCCEGSAHGASQYLLEYMHTAFYNGCLLGTTC